MVDLFSAYLFTSVDNEEERRIMSTIEFNTFITDAEWEVMRVV